MSLHAVLLSAGVLAGQLAAANAFADAAADRACARLVEAVQVRQLAGPDKRGAYRCQLQDQIPTLFVFALRWHGDGLPAVGSNLVGYYLVDAVGGDIHEWNMGEGQRGELLAAPPVGKCRRKSAASPERPSSRRQGHCKP